MRRVSYLIVIKSLLPNVVASLYHDLTSPDINPPAWALSGRIWISLVMVVLVPLSFLRRLDSLRHTSYVALFSCGECLVPHKGYRILTQLSVGSAAYLVLIVIMCYFRPLKGMTPPGEIHLIKFTPSFLSTFPIQVFAFTCSQNVKASFAIPRQLLNCGGWTVIPYLQRAQEQLAEAHEHSHWHCHWFYNSHLRDHRGLWLSHIWISCKFCIDIDDFSVRRIIYLTGQREHHRDVPSDLALCRRRATCYRGPRPFFIPIAGPSM